MSNTIPIRSISLVAAFMSAVLAGGCTAETASSPEQVTEPVGSAEQVDEEVKRTGTPAQPLGEGAPSASTTVIAMDDMKQGDDPACKITFAYAGHEPETLIWSREPCGALTTEFVGQDRLQELRKWDRLDDHARNRIAQSPGGEILYVEGAFTASIFPLDTNSLTYEVTVAD